MLCSAPLQKGPLKTQSSVFLDQLVRQQAQKASEADTENGSKLGEYGTQQAEVAG